MQANPFKPTFGQMPATLAGRDELIRDAIAGLEGAPGDPNRATLFVGPRGSGKTVLLHEIGSRASAMGWICVNVTCAEGLLDELYVQTLRAGEHLLSPKANSRITSVQVGGVGASREIAQPETTWRAKMTDLLDELNEQGTGVLFTIDEVAASFSELKAFIITYQHFVTEGRDVALMMAGLPSKVSLLLLDDDISFIRRATQRDLGSIDLASVEQAMRRTIEDAGRTIERDALTAAAKSTSGYAYMIQLVGYHLWKQHPDAATITVGDAEAAIEQARYELERAIFIPTLRDLSKREAEFLYAMAQDDSSSSVEDVAQRMGITKNNAMKLRRRLVEYGVIEDKGFGRLAFDLPLFGQFLRENPFE